MGKKLLYILYLIVVITGALEVILRFYNPFGFRQKGDAVILPRNRKMIFTNENIPVIEKQTVHTKNSLGFRGPEMPQHLSEATSIIAVGGSATECFYLNDKNCWTNLLLQALKKHDTTVWVNNAGYQGHSTYGHFILIDTYIKQLKPDYILLMAGFNEIDRYDIMENESVAKNSKKNTSWGWLKRNSELVNLALNIQRHLMADKFSVTDGYVNLKDKKIRHINKSQYQVDSTLKVQLPLIKNYAKRLQKIIDTCLANQMKPVLITQPILYGDGIDSLSGVNLETIEFRAGYNGLLTWRILEGYNDVTRRLARQNAVPLIDLAKEMPKNSLYFYDICHFTNEGCKQVSNILTTPMEKILWRDSVSQFIR
jgi:lysophospholipase L1-like esterase